MVLKKKKKKYQLEQLHEIILLPVTKLHLISIASEHLGGFK